MAVVGPSRHSRVSMSVSMSLMQGGGAGATGGGGTTGAHPGQAVLAAAAQAPPTYYHPAAPAPPPPPPAQDLVQPDRPIGYGAFGVVCLMAEKLDLVLHCRDDITQSSFYQFLFHRKQINAK